METDKILAVMGSGGSGKTTLCIKLAMELAKKHKNVIVVFCDPFTPVIPFVLPADTVHDTSLGALLTMPTLMQKHILDACVTAKESEYISFLGYRSGESLMNYPKITREKAVDFYVLLRHLADYVIIDSATVFEADVASIVGLEMADRVLRLGTSNLRGISYFQSHGILLSDSKFRPENHISAIGNLKTGQEWEAVAQQYGGVRYLLPYVPEIEQQYDEAALPEPLLSKESVLYAAEIRKILSDVFSVHFELEKQKSREKAVPVKKEAGKERTKPVFKLPFTKHKGEF